MNGAGNMSRTPLFSSHSTRTKADLTELYGIFHTVHSQIVKNLAQTVIDIKKRNELKKGFAAS